MGVLESEFLQNLVSDYPNTLGIDFNFEESEEQKPLISTDSWSLTLLEDLDKGECEEDDSKVDVKSDNFLLQLSKKKHKVRVKKNSLLRNENKRYVEKKETIASGLNEQHWSDLFLVQSVITDKVEEKDRDVETVVDHIDDDEEDIVYDLDIVEKLVVNERKRFGGDLAEYNQNPVRCEIRNKVLRSQDKGKAKFESLESLRKYWRPPVFIKSSKDKLQDCQVITKEVAVQSCASVQEPIPEETKVSYNFRRRSSSKKKEKVEIVKKPTKRFLWYEQKPFDDPVKEAKRLRNLSQKIYDDKRRFDYEILKAENRELREENVKLKEEIQKLLKFWISRITSLQPTLAFLPRIRRLFPTMLNANL